MGRVEPVAQPATGGFGWSVLVCGKEVLSTRRTGEKRDTEEVRAFEMKCICEEEKEEPDAISHRYRLPRTHPLAKRE
jgi:hypothetical protein